MKTSSWKNALVEYFFIIFPFFVVFYVRISESAQEGSISQDLGIASSIISGQLIAKYFKCTIISKAKIKVDNSILHLLLIILALTFSVTNYCLSATSEKETFQILNFVMFFITSTFHFAYSSAFSIIERNNTK